MCAVNLEKIKQERAKQQFGGELMDFPEGETGTYIAALPYPDDEVPFASLKMHYDLGPKGKFSCMCLEPSNNEVLNNPNFIAMAKEMEKDLSGGCPACEDIDAGKPVSGKPVGEDGKAVGRAGGRWLCIIMPMTYRANPTQNFQPWRSVEVKGFLVGYRVWDAICDQFGSCGDITDPDAATLIRVCRVGKKMQTKWEIQPDIETAKKPIKLGKEHRAALAEACKPGGACDPYKIIVGMAKTRQQMMDALKGIGEGADGYEESKPEGEAAAAEESKPAGSFKPPTGTKKAEAAKPETKPKEAAKKPAGDSELVKLTAAHGAPPSCFKIDADPNDPMCQACPFKGPCASHLGVPPIPDPSGDASAEDGDSADAATPEQIKVEEAVVDQLYTFDTDDQYTFKGQAKGKFLFIDPAGKPFKADPGTLITPVAQADDDDPALKALEATLAAKKKAGGKK